MKKTIKIDYESFLNDPIYDKEKLMEYIIKDFENKLGEILQGLNPTMQESLIKFKDATETLKKLAKRYHDRKTQKNDSSTKANEIINDFEEAKETIKNLQDLAPIIGKIQDAHELAIKTKKRNKCLKKFSIPLFKSIFSLINILIAISIDFLLAGLIENLSKMKIPEYAHIITITILALIGGIILNPLIEILKERFLLRYLIRRTNEFNATLNEMITLVDQANRNNP